MQAFKKDLTEWIHGRFTSLIREFSRFSPTSFLVKLYKVLIQAERADFENALFCLFSVSMEQSGAAYEKLQGYKKAFLEFQQDQDRFYNSTQIQQELTAFREDKIQSRNPIALEQVFPLMASAIRISTAEKQGVFKHSRSRYFQVPNLLEVKAVDSNVLLENALKYGSVLNFVTLKNQVSLIQFQQFESCLALAHFEKLEEASLIFFKAQTLEESQTAAGSVLKQEEAFVALSKLESALLGDQLLSQKYINKKFLKAVFFQVSEGKALLQFYTVGSAIKFLKLKEYDGACEAAMEKNPDLDQWQQMQFEQ